jgi:uroporphyrinogen III methyltransferase/synthase
MPTPSGPIVYLVGAGPGDPGLLTVAGADALRNADVVVYDYLANPELLRLCPPTAERVYVGKSGIQHTKTQAEINQILVDKARELAQAIKNQNLKIKTPSVVRLKGGDPYVFGRGGEEAEFLRAHNVPFVEIPGITSGIAAPAYAGIPVTHRDFTSTITLITGHERDDAITKSRGEYVPDREEEGERVNYDALARLDGTLVFYMGVKSLPIIVEKLQSHGMPADTPAALIRWGTRTNQQTVTGTVSTIVDVVQKAGIKAPAITIIGKVVSLRPTLNWFEERPLFGQRILVTRTRQQASDLTAQLLDLGAQVVEAPTIDILPPQEESWQEIDRTLQQIPAYDWVVFTSANGVRAAWDRLRHLTFDARHFGASHVAAIGAATQRALEQIGLVPDLLPEKFVGEELAAALKEHIGENEVRGKRFLLLRADIARPVLRDELQKLGGIVEDVAIYRTVKPAALPEEVAAFLAEGHDGWVTFTSASTANNLWDLLTPAERAQVAQMKRASIGPVTTAALEKLGNGDWRPTVVASQHDIAGLVAAIRGQHPPV